MKFNKRPMSDHETAFAMSQVLASCACDCSNLGACICPPIPTHQIQLDQATQGRNTAYEDAAHNAIAWP